MLVARTLAGRNDILLLDEPASALDLKNQDRVLGLMRDLAVIQKWAVAFKAYQPNHAMAIADRVVILQTE
jgi:iron complex transport system ATP-binding protein